jgi:hypothetical protein
VTTRIPTGSRLAIHGAIVANIAIAATKLVVAGIALVSPRPEASWPRTQDRIKLKLNSTLHPSEVKMTHASMLKARRQNQKTRKLLDVAAKQRKRLAKQALAGPAGKKEKVKTEK